VQNAAVLHGDGIRGAPERGPFDRILVDGAFTEPPTALLSQLAPTGRLVGVERGETGSHLVRFARASMHEWEKERLMPLSLPPLMAGVAAAL
jgi:protein-L-isoaspartate(D-aspartate) O-methyltransferase